MKVNKTDENMKLEFNQIKKQKELQK